MYDDIFNRFQKLSDEKQNCLLVYMDYLIACADDIIEEECVIE